MLLLYFFLALYLRSFYPDRARKLRKRGADAMLGVEDEDASYSVVHAIIPRKDWHGMTKGWSNVRESANLHGAHGRCQVQGCGKECYSVLCVCGMLSGAGQGFWCVRAEDLPELCSSSCCRG